MRRDEQGFTMVELLVAIVVASAVMGALGTALVVAFRNLDATQTRMAESHDAQLASAYVVTDVQSATTIVASQPACGAASATVASLAWSDRGTANAVTYVLETAEGERRLRRHAVVGGSAHDVVVAHFLAPTCADATQPDPAVAVTSDADRLVLTLTDGSGYRFSLTGERRAR